MRSSRSSPLSSSSAHLYSSSTSLSYSHSTHTDRERTLSHQTLHTYGKRQTDKAPPPTTLLCVPPLTPSPAPSSHHNPTYLHPI